MLCHQKYTYQWKSIILYYRNYFWWCVIMVWTCHYDLSSSVNSKRWYSLICLLIYWFFFLINSMLKMLKLLKNFDRINISKNFSYSYFAVSNILLEISCYGFSSHDSLTSWFWQPPRNIIDCFICGCNSSMTGFARHVDYESMLTKYRFRTNEEKQHTIYEK